MAWGVVTILGGEFEAGWSVWRNASARRTAARRKKNRRSKVRAERDSATFALRYRDSRRQAEPAISLGAAELRGAGPHGMPALEKYAHLILPGNGYRVVVRPRLAGDASIFAGIAQLFRFYNGCVSDCESRMW